MEVKHPATYSPTIVAALATILDKHVPAGRVLDPFAGIGGIHKVATAARLTVGIEIEPVWSDTHADTILGDAIVTSPTYGNRMADSRIARDGSYRRSYSHDMRASVGDDVAKLSTEQS